MSATTVARPLDEREDVARRDQAEGDQRRGRIGAAQRRTVRSRRASCAAPLALLAARVVAARRARPSLAFFSGGYFAGPRLVALRRRRGSRSPSRSLARRPSRCRRRAAPRARRARRRSRCSPRWTGAVARVGAARRARPTTPPSAPLLYLGAPSPRRASRFRAARRRARVEPALAAGHRSSSSATALAGRRAARPRRARRATRLAGGRLDQPLTYWNARARSRRSASCSCARLAGDRDAARSRCAPPPRRPPRRSGSASTSRSRAARSPRSRVGLAVLLALTPTWPQLRAAAIALEARRSRCASSPLPARRRGRRGRRRAAQGAIVLRRARSPSWPAPPRCRRGARAPRTTDARATGAAAAPAPRRARWRRRRRRARRRAVRRRGGRPRRPRRSRPARSARRPSASATGGSNRYEYWEVALEAFADDPAGRRRRRLVRGGVARASATIDERRPRRALARARDRSPSSGWSASRCCSLLFGGVVAARRGRRAPTRARRRAGRRARRLGRALSDRLGLGAARAHARRRRARRRAARPRERSASTATAPSTTSDGSAAKRKRVTP